MANVPLTRKYKQGSNAFPIAALLGGATIWGLLWYPYRLLEQAGFSGSVATAVTYFIALLLGLAAFRNSLRGPGVFGSKLHLLLWIGLCAGWTNLAYVLGVIHGEVVRVLLLLLALLLAGQDRIDEALNILRAVPQSDALISQIRDV